VLLEIFQSMLYFLFYSILHIFYVYFVWILPLEVLQQM